jgi:hypothetical protein
MADLIISLTGANGDTITFDYSTYILTEGLKGFGIPATQVRIQDSAGDGGIFRHTKRGVRQVDLPIVTVGADRADVETKLRRLSNILQNSQGATTLTATYANGDVFTLQVYYMGGGETVFGDAAGSTYAKWLVTLQAPNPFWTAATPTVVTIGNGSTGRGLLPKLTKLRVSSSQSIGAVTINNTSGDVASYPVWQIYGPVSGLQVYTQSNSGFTYPSLIPAGEIITINTATGTVTDSSGNNKYSNLGAAPKLFSLPPGVTGITVNGINTTPQTQVYCTYYPKREVLH